jgi:hypothetical protein
MVKMRIAEEKMFHRPDGRRVLELREEFLVKGQLGEVQVRKNRPDPGTF